MKCLKCLEAILREEMVLILAEKNYTRHINITQSLPVSFAEAPFSTIWPLASGKVLYPHAALRKSVISRVFRL